MEPSKDTNFELFFSRHVAVVFDENRNRNSKLFTYKFPLFTFVMILFTSQLSSFSFLTYHLNSRDLS